MSLMLTPQSTLAGLLIFCRLPDSLPVPAGQGPQGAGDPRVQFWSQGWGTPTTVGQEEDGRGLDPESLAWPWQQLCRTEASTGAPVWEWGGSPRPDVLLFVQPTKDFLNL